MLMPLSTRCSWKRRTSSAVAVSGDRLSQARPSARLKADEAVKLFKAGRTVTQIANALGIGRGSVYRALETCGIKQAASAASAERGM
jgi:DNA invertase Pin-like site-specific DNA recombinase